MEMRIANIRAALGEREAFLTSDGASRFYLTGFPSSAGQLLVTKRGAYFIIDFRYIEKARATVKTAEVILQANADEQIKEILARDGVSRLYVEVERTPVSDFDRLSAAFTAVEISRENKIDKLLCDLRAVKSKQELAAMQAAQDMTDATFSYILERIEAGRTERDVMLDMEFYMRRLGSDGVAFDFIVVSGKNSSLPHGVPTDKKIERGDFVTMDFGAVYGGYRSDMTRTVAVGECSDDQKKVYQTVFEAQRLAIEAIRPGKVCRDIDRIARDYIYGEGYEGCFGHGLGHSVGVEIHEMPACNPRCEAVLQAGTVMTIEPGIYLENRFGVRIEDMIYLGEKENVNLTHSRKDLIVL